MQPSISKPEDERSETIEKAGASIRATLDACGYTEKVVEQQAIGLWARAVDNRLGPQAVGMTEVREIRAGQLIVEVKKAAWRHRLTLEVPELMRSINGQLGSEVVTSIRLV